MTIQAIIEEKKISIYHLAKISSVPYTTVNDIYRGKTNLEKCSAETVYRLAQALNVSMEEILEPCLFKRSSFENYKSTICHRVKEMGDIAFIIDTLENNDIQTYYEKKWYPECLYLLAMLDYISRVNGVPLCNEYDDLRQCKLNKTIYPASLKAASKVLDNDSILIEAEHAAIPEFKRFNIIENEVRNVI